MGIQITAEGRNPFVNQVFVVLAGDWFVTGKYRRNPFVNQVFVVSQQRSFQWKEYQSRNPFVNQVFVVVCAAHGELVESLRVAIPS